MSVINFIVHMNLPLKSLLDLSIHRDRQRKAELLSDLSETISPTPSLLQMQLVHGDGKALSPTCTCLSPMMQPLLALSLHAFRSMPGKLLQSTLGFKKFEGKSKAALWISPAWSMFSHINLASVALRISANWFSVKRTVGSMFSYLKRSYFQILEHKIIRNIFEV